MGAAQKSIQRKTCTFSDGQLGQKFSEALLAAGAAGAEN
jgi:hypothetical protein